jgi:hypothetical protein
LCSALLRWHVERDRYAGHLCSLRELQPPPPVIGVQSQSVDDGGQAARQSPLDYFLEKVESVLACLDIVLTPADYCA